MSSAIKCANLKVNNEWGEIMTRLLVIDVGGTSIKFGKWDQRRLALLPAVKTPSGRDGFFTVVSHACEQIRQSGRLDGVAISIPGVVNKRTGIIEGPSQIPYIHYFPIAKRLQSVTQTKVSLENDANCAGLAECHLGPGKMDPSILMIILGTGIGGALITRGQVHHGAHLYAGELGETLAPYPEGDDITLTSLASPASVARRYNHQTGQHLSGKEVFQKADHGDRTATKIVQTMINNLAATIYNLQYSFDPHHFVIGGAISRNPTLLPRLNQAIKDIRQRINHAGITPTLTTSVFRGRGNLLGAVIDFYQMYNLDLGEVEQAAIIDK